MKLSSDLYFRVYSDGTIAKEFVTELPPLDQLGWMRVTHFEPAHHPGKSDEVQLLEKIVSLLEENNSVGERAIRCLCDVETAVQNSTR